MFSSSLEHEEDIFNEFLESELMFIEKSLMVAKNESPKLKEEEKHIAIDPISLKKESSTAYPNLEVSPPQLPSKTKFVSASLPNSATSSPRFGLKKKCKIQGLKLPLEYFDPMPRQHSIALSRLAELKERHTLIRSKSCGEGRSTYPSEDFDMWSPKKVNYLEKIDYSYADKNMTSFRHKIESPNFNNGYKKHMEPSFDDDEKVKCGALCLYLPGFGKGKPVRPRKEIANFGEPRKDIASFPVYGKEKPCVISRSVSLEKFECGSWTSSAIILENEDHKDGVSRNFFIDLPFEMIRNSVNDTESPVKAAFLFDNKDVKGVLKTSSPRVSERKSQSTRHVRFSTSSPPGSDPTSPTTCITPRLRKAREDFNAFLQAQSA